MALKLRTPGRVTIGAVTYAVDDFQIVPDVQTQQVVHSGFAQAQQVLVPGSGVPMIRARGPLGRLLTGLGLVTTAPTVATATLGSVTGAIIDAGSTHTAYVKEAGALVCAYIDAFSVQEGGYASADVVLRYYADDGVTAPISVSNSVAFPALTAAALHHGVGELTVNGTLLEGVVGISYSSGYQFSAVRSDAKPWPIGEVQTGGMPSLTVEVVAPKESWDEITAGGSAIGSTTTVTLHAYTAGSGALTATGKITLTVGAGMAHCEQWGGAHGEMVRGSIRILPASADGAAHGIAVS
jgi:hypothetical protein